MLKKVERVRAAGVTNLADLRHHQQCQQQVVEAHRVLDEQRVATPVGKDRCAIVAPPQQPARQQEFGGAIPADLGLVAEVAPGGRVARKPSQWKEGLLE